MNLNQVTVPVSNVETSVAFYEKLGLKLIVKSLPDYARFICSEGNSTFSLYQFEISGNAAEVWVYFEVKNLDDYVSQLVENGIVFEELPADKPWLWREARLRDPDDNQIILYFAGENRINPPWRIK